MKDLKEILEDVITELEEDSKILPADLNQPLEIPTLKKGHSKLLSPQLKLRFTRLGSWQDSTHGDWLSLEEIRKLVDGNTDTSRLIGIETNLKAAAKNWTNDVAALFLPERISYFAASEFTSERVYLIWFDDYEEPEICVYDVNGESRYLDLKAYLNAYLEEDKDEESKTWKLQDNG